MQYGEPDYDDLDEEWVDDDDDDSEDDLLVCPSCNGSVHEDTQQCPHCGDWIIPRYPSGPFKRYVWPIVTLLLLLAIVLTYVL
ncbi:MAG: hypothetical protein IIB60_02275 [Planctomycetes bacterium]|nr:hypothetical protein [Planctomycetota bacterium]